MSDPQRTASYLDEITLLRAEVAMWKGIHEGAVAATTADVDRLRAENERLKVESIQMQAALGYGILAEDERHILPSNPFKCGTCDASKHLRAEVERLKAEITGRQAHDRMQVREIVGLSEEVARLRAAATALINFHNGSREAKRPDVFHLLMVRLNAALEEETSA